MTTPQRPGRPATASPPAEASLAAPDGVADPYQERGALSDPAVCGHCGAVYAGGTWHWGPAPPHASRVRCVACHRTDDNVPAGYVTLEGPYASTHRDELEEEIARYAHLARTAHPMRRVMAMEEVGGRLLVTTTDVELAHDIAQELRRRHGGELDGHFNREEFLIRMRWRH
ncbi:hypothetical protein IP92_01092 [Pseudoduganella flava]|uniref:ATPase n=1 Tax=Pseudoduganella flava TaxID=871742 RepID=A0A562PZL7_9BURK|nr:BCAM0308 family protein [Pseudoduganella flava]QGZ38568.1 ATPase [Pseudoduganella flava]TWI49869.1 hypothetical protein IP92_01092 [Pseudoduganella flava]